MREISPLRRDHVEVSSRVERELSNKRLGRVAKASCITGSEGKSVWSCPETEGIGRSSTKYAELSFHDITEFQVTIPHVQDQPSEHQLPTVGLGFHRFRKQR